MHGEICVALAIALLGIRKTRSAVRVTPSTISSLPNGSGRSDFASSSLARARPSLRRFACETAARHADHVADVEQIELRVRGLAQFVSPEVELNAPAAVGDVRERRLPMRAPRYDPPRYRTFAPSSVCGSGRIAADAV